jgi:NAD(P)H-nitrite reductase large subunit
MNEKICYCFNYTEADLVKDVLENGRSTIMERIMAESKQGNCDCAKNNPKGR